MLLHRTGHSATAPYKQSCLQSNCKMSVLGQGGRAERGGRANGCGTGGNGEQVALASAVGRGLSCGPWTVSHGQYPMEHADSAHCVFRLVLSIQYVHARVQAHSSIHLCAMCHIALLKNCCEADCILPDSRTVPGLKPPSSALKEHQVSFQYCISKRAVGSIRPKCPRFYHAQLSSERSEPLPFFLVVATTMP
jgi:hypothetical protein